MAGVDNSDVASNADLLIGEPLDTMVVRVSGRNGIQRNVPALHIGFMELRNYVYFKPVPVITDDTGQEDLTPEEEEWIECVSFLEDDLHWLLRLPHHRFWSQVVHEEDMHKCLESYLTLAPRDYDIINMKMKDDVQKALQRVHRLVFLVFLRMSTYKESKEHHLRPKAYGDIIYDNYVFDVPKLMDICVLYGFRNKALLTKMIKNIFTTQPKYTEDLSNACNFALNAFSFAEEKLFLNVPGKNSGCRKLEDNTFTGIKEMSFPAFCNVIGYITDACATVYMFLEIYSPACEIFRQNGAITRIASFYEQTFPPIEKEIKRMLKMNDEINLIDSMKKKVILSKSFLIKTFRNILSYCCIQHILDFNCIQTRTSHIEPSEEFIEIFTEVACEKIFLHDYNLIYPFECDIELINQTGAYLDPERLSYVFGSIHDTLETNAQVFTSTAENGARPKISKNSIPNDESVKSLHGIAAILMPKSQNSQQSDISLSESEDSRPSVYQMESLIHSVLDVFPHYGEGFVEEGLKYFGYDSFKLIDSILTNSLPDCLEKLDRSMQRTPSLLTKPCMQISDTSILAERRNIYDNDEFDVFSRDDVNMKNIHIGKKNKTPDSYQSLQNEEQSEFLKKLICTYGNQESDDDELEINRKIDIIYEDEYDDTYDSTLVGVKEPLIENEPDKEDPNEKEEIVEEEHQPDDFCVNPEKQRKEYEEKRQAKLAARNKGGAPVNQNSDNNRQNKERNKAYSGNHNRRKQSDYKKSRGMVPFPTR